MRILLAVDGSECSEAATTSLGTRIWPADAEFMIISVAEPVMTDLGGWVSPDTKERHQRVVDKAIEFLRTQLPHHKLSSKLAEGMAADEIARIAKDWSADFVVVGSHGRRGLSHLFLGSVAESIVHKSPCSVEVIKTRQPVSVSESQSATHIKQNAQP